MAAASWHANPTGARLANPLRAHYCLDLDRGQGRVRPHPSIPAANHDKILPNFVATTKQGQELIASTIVNVAHQSKAHAPLYTTLNTAARMAMRLPLGWACRPIQTPTGRRPIPASQASWICSAVGSRAKPAPGWDEPALGIDHGRDLHRRAGSARRPPIRGVLWAKAGNSPVHRLPRAARGPAPRAPPAFPVVTV
jgi:hypothetical protein